MNVRDRGYYLDAVRLSDREPLGFSVWLQLCKRLIAVRRDAWRQVDKEPRGRDAR